jgi:hypothetical protein
LLKWRWPSPEPDSPQQQQGQSDRNKVIDRKPRRADYRDCRDKLDQRAHQDVIAMSVKSWKNPRILASNQKCDARSNQFRRDALPRGRNDKVWLCARSSDGFSCITASIAAIRYRVCQRSEMLGAMPERDVHQPSRELANQD